MSTEPNLLGQSTLIESHNKSTFDERMERVAEGKSVDNKGESVDNKGKSMTMDEVIKLKTGGKRYRKSQRKGKSQRKSQRKSYRKHQRKTRK